MEIPGALGRLTVSDDVVEALAAAAVPDPEGLVRLRPPKGVAERLRRRPPASMERAVAVHVGEGGALTVDAHVAVRLGASVEAVARGIRERLEEALGAALGVKPERVVVYVDAVLDAHAR